MNKTLVALPTQKVFKRLTKERHLTECLSTNLPLKMIKKNFERGDNSALLNGFPFYNFTFDGKFVTSPF
jgi:hypothetical protein